MHFACSRPASDTKLIAIFIPRRAMKNVGGNESQTNDIIKLRRRGLRRATATLSEGRATVAVLSVKQL